MAEQTPSGIGEGARSRAGSAREEAHAVKPRLLDQVRFSLRARHYSRRTEKAYVQWIRRFIVFHGKKHPATLGEAEVN
jgi:hypothetical protein